MRRLQTVHGVGGAYFSRLHHKGNQPRCQSQQEDRILKPEVNSKAHGIKTLARPSRTL